MKADFLKIGEPTQVVMINADGKAVYTYDTTDVHDISEAVAQAYAASGETGQPQLYVYDVTNLQSGITHQYRVNADDSVVLIPEEY